MFDKIDFKPGQIVFSDFNIDTNIPLLEQVDSLKEDLFQVNYLEKYIIDVGWYPEFDENGNFKISVIQDFNWEKPLLSKTCNNLNQLNYYIIDSINLIKDLMVRRQEYININTR